MPFRKPLIFIFMLSALTLNAQSVVTLHQEGIDDKLYHFGFLLGFNSLDFGIQHSLLPYKDGKTYLAEVSDPQPGFSVGIIGDYRLHRYFNLRTSPSIHFGSRELKYVAVSQGSTIPVYAGKAVISSVIADVPLLIKYSAERYQNIRPYVIGGVGATFDLAKDDDTSLNLNLFDTYVCIGVGTDFYFPYFKLAPELKFCFGLNDVLSRNIAESNLHPEFIKAITKLSSRFVTLTFNIE